MSCLGFYLVSGRVIPYNYSGVAKTIQQHEHPEYEARHLIGGKEMLLGGCV